MLKAEFNLSITMPSIDNYITVKVKPMLLETRVDTIGLAIEQPVTKKAMSFLAYWREVITTSSCWVGG